MERRKFISQMGLLGVGINSFHHIPSGLRGVNGEIDEAGKDAGNEKIIISIKIIKSKPGSSTGKPHIEFPPSNRIWSSDIRSDKYGTQQNKYGELDGENIWEIYFNIQSENSRFTKQRLQVVVPGIEVARVIVGHTDVPFEQKGDAVEFEIIDDRSMGQYMESEAYKSPLGGYPIGFIHNWDIRRAGKYALEGFPYKRFAAVPNYLLAAQEVLRQMGNMGPGNTKAFNGEISLLGSEVASSRGHMDYPPHVHIMLYEFDKDKKWKSRLAPHFYMDDEGYIIHNHYSRIVGIHGTASGEYGVGDLVQFVDDEGNSALGLTIEEKGVLALRSYDGREYRLVPDPVKGPSEAVFGYFHNKLVCKARVRDFPDLGIFRIQLEVFTDGKKTRDVNDGYLYDPFTGNRHKNLYDG